jgi:dolichyl-phosphate-mannose--protein O-mannosyl transferase
VLNLLARLLRLRIAVHRFAFDSRSPSRVPWDAVAGPLIGVAAGWLPWVYFHERTTFTFYTIVFTPFVCMIAAQGLGLFATRRIRLAPMDGDAEGGIAEAPLERSHLEYDELHPRRFLVAAVVVGLAVGFAIFALPVWTGGVLPYSGWRLRMLFSSWV